MPNGKWPEDITRDQGRFRSRRGSSPTGCSSRPRRRCPRTRGRWCIPTADAAAGGPDGWCSWTATAWHGRRAPRAVGVPRTHEDGIRLSRALGGAYPRRGARPDRRLHPLAQPRSHQTVARLDEPGTISSKPGNGCVIISKKNVPQPPTKKTGLSAPTIRHECSSGRMVYHANRYGHKRTDQEHGLTRKSQCPQRPLFK